MGLLNDGEIDSAFDGAFDKPVNFDHKPTPEEIILIRLRAVAKAQQELTNKEWVEWVEKHAVDESEVGVIYTDEWQARLKEVNNEQSTPV